ncbi:MAG: hypothetical protein P0Y65_09320 [Candidatus Devosia phytovorans]|uniref:DUF4168 domain-containing protein n=1 Tax=Candidatus Devosia phytovorans TaxID=3121372 RepID=A0AAJ5VYW7_9HYPH|nr:hypothetical protein [Devosia sp.]WEK06420.1 MAG: hypothetical protein P0Y65_09320 [Devosia sp.]
MGRFLSGYAAAVAVVMGLGSSVAAQTPETISRIIEELNFNGGYEARVDALIEQFAAKPAVWRNDADPVEVRAETMALQPEAEARLREVLAIKFYEDELQDVLAEVEEAGQVDFTQEGLLYALNHEFDSAISDFVMPMIGW